ncbi:hypothetical protein ASD67_12330 [Sphingopyxis sp. Root1497]|uniref:SDR family oxidoreductase n=1 Tax=Sphingopyxis sp. Root1497 TaxID=1736474 RepID=UPI0006FFA230|nr:SDR family oxidoreductase [Sphingopyxis sp. Root1497]KQZ62332.1 hypothetical protein ASD67_12330 [Sphingopyxis sp. Root1497]
MRASFAIEGRTAFVTGGGSGIGLAIGRALAREGARVALADIDGEALERETAALGDAAMAVALDVTDRDAWARARQAVEARFGPVSILINNAGIGPDLNLLDAMPEAHFDRIVAVKLTGTYNGVRCFVPAMREAGRGGHVVNTASMAGLIASAKLGGYTASKFAVVGLSEVLRAELEPDGIGVSVLCPGLVTTNLGRSTGRAPRAGGMDPAVVGDMVVRGIRKNRLHIVTLGQHRGLVADRMARVVAAFDDIPTDYPDSRPASDTQKYEEPKNDA